MATGSGVDGDVRPAPAGGVPVKATAFDAYQFSYDEVLRRGLRLSGEGKEYFAEGRLRWLRAFLAARDAAPSAVLDYGCGTGAGTLMASAILGAERTVGVDLSSGLLDDARRLPHRDGVEFRHLSELEPVPRFDVTFCNGVFHHIAPLDRADAVRYVYKRLRPGGIFALWENNPWNPGTRLVMRRIPFDRDAILLSPADARGLLVRGGFRVERTAFLFYFPRLLAALRPLERFLRGVPLGAQYCVIGVR
jgi:SAM-dependent methyltransferase